MRSAVILAGGAGSRLGTEKSLLKFGGRSLICWTVEKLQRAADEVIIVARNANQAAMLRTVVQAKDIVFTCDSVSGFGPVAGLESGMRYAKGGLVFATGCDLPFLNVLVIEKLFELAEAEGYDAAVPGRQNGMMEPLHAVYDREKMLRACENALERGERRIQAPLRELRVNRVSVDLFRSIDPQLLTFFNINTPDDLKEVRRLWKVAGLGSRSLQP
ncbi:MAG: molybdenum cofactor guanylyltransferase [Methanotrichaceae archaeon]|nr:molybdenum cofactor guanylyltransferase [Methanotrichaceae archaeon]